MVARHFAEHQIYRIDHYLGKETVQNLMVLRFGNAIFEPLWRAPYIKAVQITVAETVGVGSRAGFYDHTGAMRDMVQNHLLQLLCFVAMEPSISLEPDDVPDEKLKVLRSLRPIAFDELKPRHRARPVRRGRRRRRARRPAREDGVPPTAAMDLRRAAPRRSTTRWAGVPFFLRTGKRMQERRSDHRRVRRAAVLDLWREPRQRGRRTGC